MGRMNEGIRSTRASASDVQGTADGVDGRALVDHGRERTAARLGPGLRLTLADLGDVTFEGVGPRVGHHRAHVLERSRRRGPAHLDAETPTICVSNGLVSIATRKPHSGHRNVTASEPSSGPSVEWSFIGSSQSRHRNFMARHSITPSRAAARRLARNGELC